MGPVRSILAGEQHRAVIRRTKTAAEPCLPVPAVQDTADNLIRPPRRAPSTACAERAP